MGSELKLVVGFRFRELTIVGGAGPEIEQLLMSRIAPSILTAATILSSFGASRAVASTGFEDSLALKSNPDDGAEELGIVGGQIAKTCHFPTAAYLGGCTATLIHPKVVTTANHCLRSSRETRSISSW